MPVRCFRDRGTLAIGDHDKKEEQKYDPWSHGPVGAESERVVPRSQVLTSSQSNKHAFEIHQPIYPLVKPVCV